MEWPLSRRYWKYPMIAELFSQLTRFDARLNGCAYGFQVRGGVRDGKFLAKPWRVMSTIPHLTGVT